MPGLLTNGLPTVQGTAVAGATYFAMNGYEKLPVDTELASGQSPQTVAATAMQIAALSAALAANAGTESSNAVTMNVIAGTITSASQTTAAGSTYTVTLTNSVVTATSVVQAAVYSKTNTTPGLEIKSITPAAGSVVIVVLNNGAAALNGTIVIPFQVSAS
jgi:hypothetical protein